MELMKYEVAKNLADEFVREIIEFCDKVEVVGSIRRLKPSGIKDIDLVILPKEGIDFKSKISLIQDWCMKHFKTFKVIKQGDKLVELYYQDAKIDIYISNKDNFETLKLIRTGSEFHNKKLCGLAISKGMRMKFDKGLVDNSGNVVANTEDSILEKLLGKVPSPEERI